MEIKRKKILRIALITILSLLVVVTATLAWFSNHYNKTLETKIAGWVAEATDSTYTAEVADVRISIRQRNLVATNIRLIPNVNRMRVLQQQGTGTAMYYEITIPKMTASGIKWRGLLGDKEIDCKRLAIQRPVITITRPYNFKNHPAKEGGKKQDDPQLNRLHTGKIRINDAMVIYRYISSSDTSYIYLDNGNIALNDWTFEPAAPKDKDAFAFAKDGQIGFESIRHEQGINLYRVACGQIRFSSEQNGFTLKNLIIEPTLSNDEFYKKVGKRVEIFRLKVPELNISGFNWKKLLGRGEVIADNISIANATFRIHYSLLPPSSGDNSPKIGRFPQQLLQKIGTPVDVKNIHLKKSLITYTEVSPVTRRSGTLAFSDINGHITNATNIPERIRNNQYAVAQLSGKLNRGADLRAKFSFYLADSSGSFTLTGYAKNIKAAQIDEPSQALALTEIKSLQVDSVSINIAGNERSSRGHFTMLYRDLKIGIQKIEKETGEVKGKGFSSFIANKALLHEENPEAGQPVRTATSYVLRKPTAGFFNIIWNNIFQGAANTAARNGEIVKLIE